MEQDSTCPYCNERPMGKRKNAATCGDATCQRKRNNERAVSYTHLTLPTIYSV